MVNRYKVRVTPQARNDLNDIFQYLQEKESTKTATNVRQGIIDAIDRLETFPEAHEVFKEISSKKVIFRRMLQWKYKIVFTVDKEELVVLVVKIYHGRQLQESIVKELKL